MLDRGSAYALPNIPSKLTKPRDGRLWPRALRLVPSDAADADIVPLGVPYRERREGPSVDPLKSS